MDGLHVYFSGVARSLVLAGHLLYASPWCFGQARARPGPAFAMPLVYLLIITMTLSVNVAISPQNNLYESSYCNSLHNGILSLKSLYDSVILEKSFPGPSTSIKFPRSRDISLSLGTLI